MRIHADIPGYDGRNRRRRRAILLSSDMRRAGGPFSESVSMNRFGYRLICRCGMLLFVFILFSCTGTDRTIAGAERGDSSGRTGTVGDGSTQDSTGIEKYRNLWERQTREKAYDEVIRSARFAFEKGESDGNRSLSVYATAYLAQSYMLKDDDDSTCYWLAESFERIGKLPREDLFIVGTVNNIAGIRAMKSESDYSSALRYFKAALSAVEKAGDTLNQGAILQNIAHIYQVREDVSGFDYALRSYELVAARGGINARSTAAVVLSSMYVLKGDYAQALRYADISVARIDDSSYWDANKAYVWYNYGDVCASAGDDARAEASYRKALEYVPSAGTAIGIRAYVSFGNFYLKQKKYRGAVEMYRRAEELLGSGNVECRAPVYSGLARAYDASGDGAKALVLPEVLRSLFDDGQLRQGTCFQRAADEVRTVGTSASHGTQRDGTAPERPQYYGRRFRDAARNRFFPLCLFALSAEERDVPGTRAAESQLWGTSERMRTARGCSESERAAGAVENLRTVGGVDAEREDLPQKGPDAPDAGGNAGHQYDVHVPYRQQFLG